MQYKTFFLILKFITIIVSILGICLSGTRFSVVGIAIVLVMVITDYIIRSCPYCGKHLDIRLHVNKNTRCPHYGEVLNGDNDKEK